MIISDANWLRCDNNIPTNAKNYTKLQIQARATAFYSLDSMRLLSIVGRMLTWTTSSLLANQMPKACKNFVVDCIKSNQVTLSLSTVYVMWSKISPYVGSDLCFRGHGQIRHSLWCLQFLQLLSQRAWTWTWTSAIIAVFYILYNMQERLVREMALWGIQNCLSSTMTQALYRIKWLFFFFFWSLFFIPNMCIKWDHYCADIM